MISRKESIVSDPTRNRDPEVQALLDKQEIYEAVLRYCRGMDRIDPSIVASVFHPDATDHHGVYEGPAAALGQLSVEAAKSVKTWTHFIGNVLIDVEGDEARSEAYFIASMRKERGGSEYDEIVAGRYIDEFERRRGMWKIARRLTVHDWSRVDAVTERWTLADQFLQGARAPEDHIYKMKGSRLARTTT